jgi:hypothetical protein
MEGGRIVENSGVERQIPVGSSGQGSNFVVMSARQADAASNMRLLIG